MIGIIGLLITLWICWFFIKRFGFVKFFIGVIVFDVVVAMAEFLCHFG